MKQFTKEQIETYNEAIRSSANDLRAKGLRIEAHAETRLSSGEEGIVWTFSFRVDGTDSPSWAGRTVIRAEGKTDAEALDIVRAEYAQMTDDLHHAPMCPANHYHGKRAPTGPCSCGAARLNKGEPACT